MKLKATRLDGAPFDLTVTARTSRVRLYKEKEVGFVDLAGLAQAAPALTIFETNHDDATLWHHVEELAALPLTNLTLTVDATTDLTPLARSLTLRHLSLSLHRRAAFDTSWLAELTTLESLSLSMKGASAEVALEPLARLPRLRSLSLQGIGNTALVYAGLHSFNATACPALRSLSLDGNVKYLHVMSCDAFTSLDTVSLAGPSLENLHLAGLPSLESIDLAPLAGCTALRFFTLVNHGAAYLDVTPLAGIATLTSVQLDGKNAPVLASTAQIRSPAVQRHAQSGAFERI